MIAVCVSDHQRETAREFFELFKTPWEFYRPGRFYPILFSTTSGALEVLNLESPPRLLLLFSPHPMEIDPAPTASMSRSTVQGLVTCSVLHDCGKGNETGMPLYGPVSIFETEPPGGLKQIGPLRQLLREATSQRTVACAFDSSSGKTQILRVGYDILDEIDRLLINGQPAAHAAIPTLELHIDALRQWITGAGVALIEIPPVPEGHPFIACLTHDIDHPFLRNHCCDHTMIGFLYRATFGSLMGLLQGRQTLLSAWRNLSAVLRLPLIFLHLEDDPWTACFKSYQQLECDAGNGSTFFVISKRGEPGERVPADTAASAAPLLRASGYDLLAIAPVLREMIAAGAEVGVHGIDAWCNAASACTERQLVESAIGGSTTTAGHATTVATTTATTTTFVSPTTLGSGGEIGIRMHWLYFDVLESPATLEQAGFSYDSTIGYCETIGFRAGTAQAWCPPGASSLLELPLHIMDTALFYPSYLHLTEAEAQSQVKTLTDSVQQFGGALTVNWHDRSLAPERNWEGFHKNLITEFKNRNAWLPTAGMAVAWFRKRRSASLKIATDSQGNTRIEATSTCTDDQIQIPELPGLRIRVHKPVANSLLEAPSPSQQAGFTDFPFRCQIVSQDYLCQTSDVRRQRTED
ncbi:MAG: hypothetical protein R3F19_30825 [Verrucomicrobiales bacterium]